MWRSDRRERGAPPAGWSLKAKSVALLGSYALFLGVVYGGFTTFLIALRTFKTTGIDLEFLCLGNDFAFS